MQDIEKDLVRWQRGKWAAVILAVFALQLWLFIGASQKQVHSREIYPAEPEVTFAKAAEKLDREWLELENPFLFAAATRNGFSGEAWLEQPDWRIPEPQIKSEPAFLRLTEAREIPKRQLSEQSFAFVPPMRASAALPSPPPEKIARKGHSDLTISGFEGRELAAALLVPVQFHTDVLPSTTVEAMIDRDGLVISARVIRSSGSSKADSEALALAGRARFVPSRSGENAPAVGKLIFDWFTLHLSDTNNVKR